MKHSLLLLASVLMTVVVHAQTPTVTTLSPARNASSVVRTAPVSITLSQPIGAGAGNVRVFSAQRGGRLAGTATVAGNTLMFLPPQNFQPGEVVSVTVPTTLQSSAGTPLAAAQVYQFTAAASGGTGTFLAGGLVPAGTSPQNVVAADVDSDGDQDLLAANFSNNPGTVSVRLNNGSGSFTSSPSVTVDNSPSMLAVADLDGDSDLDLISSNGATLIIRFNNGLGIFSGGSDRVVAGSTSQLVTGDVDGDGDIDLLTVSGSIPAVSILLNNGAGTFTPGAIINSGIVPFGNNALVLGDVDGDGDLDFITNSPGGINSTYNLDLRRNNGNGTFGTAITIPIAAPTPNDLALVDLDADGDLDLLSTNTTDVNIRLNNGQGVFTGSGTAGISTRVTDINTGDLDGDGDLDLFTTSYGTAGIIDIRLNNGTGTFSGTTSLVFPAEITDATAADLDGDGDLDLLASGRVSSNVHVLLNRNSGPTLTVSSLAPTRNLRNAARASNVVVGFSQALTNTPATTAALKVFSNQRGGLLTGTGVVAGNTLTFDPGTDFKPGERVTVSVTTAARSASLPLGQPQVFQFTTAVTGGTGTFGGATSLGGAMFATTVVTADLDNDGDLDVMSAGNGARTSWNNGNGTFSSGTGIGGDGMDVADMDGDGDIDVLNSNGDGTTGSTGTVTVHLNNGSGTFALGTTVPVGRLTMGVTAGDIDGDGDQDFVVINGYAVVGVCLNTGGGSFSSVMDMPIAGTPFKLALHDVDNDGDLDLLAALSGQVGVYLNDGIGNFGPATYVAMPSSSRALAAADVNGDGSLDLLTTSGSRVDVRLNDGSGNFGSGSSLNVASGGATSVAGIAIGDLDGDGDLDLVTGGGSGIGIMSVRLNNGNGIFGGGYDPVVSGPFQTMPGGTALADMDGDGDLDLLVANYNSPNGGVRLILNQLNSTITAISPVSGMVGSTVTITGTNLTGATSLTLNAVAITNFTVVSSTSITFVVPTGASSGRVVVTTPLGTATSPSFTVDRSVISSFAPAFGSVGTTVTMTGQNLTGATALTINGMTVPNFTVTSSTNITFVVPVGATTGLIMVTTPWGTAISTTNFTVIPTPTITTVSPVSGTAGSMVTITGTNLTGATSLTINGVAITSFTVVSSTSITFVVPVGATTGFITVTTPWGTATSTQNFTVNNLAPALITVAPATVAAGSATMQVLLSGNNFVSQSQVLFNGTIVSTILLSPNILVATIPASALTTAGTYSLVVTTPAPGGGTTAVNLVVTLVSATHLPATGLELTLYPNPTHSFFNLRLRGLPPTQRTIQVELLNQLGQVVVNQILPLTSQQVEAIVPVSHLAAGFYILRMHTSLGTITRQVGVE